MKNNFKKRLDELEELTITTKPLVICCDQGEDVKKLVAEWHEKYGDVPPELPLIIIQKTGYVDK